MGGYHGLVTELAIDYQTNLKPIYAILSNVLHGFAPQLPGPKSAEESRLLDRIATLDATNRLLQRENEQLHRCLRQSVEVTPERLERMLLTGIGEMLPYETIQTIVSVAYRPLNGNFRYNSLLVFPQSRMASDLLKYDFLPKIF